jgi:dihydroneopterin aldolase
VRVGLLPQEHDAPQSLCVSAQAYMEPAHFHDAAQGDFVDYALLHDCIKGWEARPHTRLLEELALSLFETAFAQSAVTAMRVSIGKEEIFTAAAQAGIDVTLSRADWER